MAKMDAVPPNQYADRQVKALLQANPQLNRRDVQIRRGPKSTLVRVKLPPGSKGIKAQGPVLRREIDTMKIRVNHNPVNYSTVPYTRNHEAVVTGNKGKVFVRMHDTKPPGDNQRRLWLSASNKGKKRAVLGIRYTANGQPFKRSKKN